MAWEQGSSLHGFAQSPAEILAGPLGVSVWQVALMSTNYTQHKWCSSFLKYISTVQHFLPFLCFVPPFVCEAQPGQVCSQKLVLSFILQWELTSDKKMGGNRWNNWQLHPPQTFCLQLYNSITKAQGKPGLLHEQIRRAGCEKFSKLSSVGKLSIYKSAWRDPRFGQSRGDMGE